MAVGDSGPWGYHPWWAENQPQLTTNRRFGGAWGVKIPPNLSQLWKRDIILKITSTKSQISSFLKDVDYTAFGMALPAACDS